MIKLVVSKQEANKRVFDFLKSKLKGELSNRKIKESIDLGGCLINNRVERYGNVVLRAGDTVEVKIRKREYLTFEKERILFESEDVLAYNKPAGLVSDASGVAILKQYNKNLSLVHRLDQYTTGVLLLAKNEKSKVVLDNLFRNREVEKTYLTIVVGRLKKSSGVIKNRIGKIEEGKWGEVKDGRDAETRWKLLKQLEETALVECTPITGRTHQIRVHMAAMGYPVLGDDRYGQKQPLKNHPDHYLLHSYRIKFQDIEIEAPFPKKLIRMGYTI